MSDEICGKNNLENSGITSAGDLQKKLNLILKKSAQDLIDTKKTGREKVLFEVFMKKYHETWKQKFGKYLDPSH